MAGCFPVLLPPELDEAEDFVGFFSLAQVGIGVAEHLALRVLGEEGQDGLAPLAAAGGVMLFHERVVAKVGDGMEVEIERNGVDQLLLAQDLNPRAQQTNDGLYVPGGKNTAPCRWSWGWH